MKLPKLDQMGITHILAPIAFIAIFAAIGGIVLLKSHAAPVVTSQAATVQTQTENLFGVSNIYKSSGSKIVSDTFGSEQVQVAKVNTGGNVFYGGKGGQTVAPLAWKSCYLLRAPNNAKVKIYAMDGTIVTSTVKAWPYGGIPMYQRTCPSDGVKPTGTAPIPTLAVVSGGPVYFYGIENQVTWPY